MGCSSRPDLHAKTKDEVDDYYCQPLEKWRIAMNLDQLNLIGHSFGGYIANRYAVLHPQNVKKLILWSPLGAEPRYDTTSERFKERMKNAGCRFR